MDPTLPWALAGLLVAALALYRRRTWGAPKAAAVLVTVGVVMLASEDGFLSVWYPLAPPSLDPHGVAETANPHARAHMLGAGVWTLVCAGLVVALAWGPMRRQEAWAWRAVVIALAVTGLADVLAYGALYTHGLDLPLPGAHGGFGWPPVAVALASWTAGVVMGRVR